MARAPILAAGGIVTRGGARPRIAVVQRRKDDGWVLPKGKLKRKERAITAARREAREETGHEVRVREFLGIMSSSASGRIKVVQFWRMEAVASMPTKPMGDIKAVEWLPIPTAVRRLSLADERAFLDNVRRRLAKPHERTPAPERRTIAPRAARASIPRTARRRTRWRRRSTASAKW